MRAQEADHILVPLLNGGFTLAQVARLDDDGALIYITHRPVTPTSKIRAFASDDIQAAVFTDLAGIPDGHWPIVGYEPIPKLLHSAPWTLSDTDRTIHDPAIIEALANALHGLYPWDGFPEPVFFANMLCHPETRPARAVMTADLPKPEAT